MDWKGGRRSDNINDQRGNPMAGGIGGGSALLSIFVRLIPYLLGTKIGRIILVIGGLVYFGSRFMGVDTPQPTSQQSAATVAVNQSAEEKELADFVSVILADTEDTWHAEFKKMGRTYQEPVLSLFRGAVDSACGLGQAAMGPFYCPADKQVYIDLSFYQEMKSRLGAPGDFAQAYVIAHEIGHHVQNLLGTSAKVTAAQQRTSKINANTLSVQLELQADCYAGIWGHYSAQNRQWLETGDIEEALNAAAAIGDDKLQRQATGNVRPEAFTHGTSEQRVTWFKRGFETGSLEACDTFSQSSHPPQSNHANQPTPTPNSH